MPGNGLRTERVVSAGGVVWRRTAPAELEILLCYRKAENLWALPKGTPEPGENMEQTALREVREETGVEVEADGVVGDINYWFSRPAEGVRFRKTVHHFLFRPIGGDTSLHDHEFDDVRWIEVQEGLKLMTYQNEVRIVREAITIIASRENEAGS
jgi:8-oxo-dGTP pyrophosphatase MutT (NUDIX family)